MQSTPKSLRLQIGIFGRTNVGKSSVLNMVLGQDYAITSPLPGTTTDVVEKVMELLPVGPVLFLDTAGVDDRSALAQLRLQKTHKIFDRSDIGLLILEPDLWTEYEELIANICREKQIPLIAVVNKADIKKPSAEFLAVLRLVTPNSLTCSCVDLPAREGYVSAFKKHILAVCPEEFLNPPAIAGDLVPPAGLAVLVVPIDLAAPKGRLILPQVQAIRDLLDNDAAALVVKEREYASLLSRLNQPPDVVICDSQVVQKMVADTPKSVKCTTFSILFARYKGDLRSMVKGAAAIDHLFDGDRVLIAEACSHHALEDDIGRVKIPRWLRQYTGKDLRIDTFAGRDFPDDLKDYKLIIHCGACALTRREMLARIAAAQQAGVPITNYGVCIALLQGVLRRVLEPFGC
ncbi:MAG: [FeFe] hydrogenase H-cluster maturation GTPase HydF [Candidatus Omnitrophica bacterium]|nr:[FeFe] hydrogenase H-cluster maturation GTPase HydF [Candidatus Omnitrophota bacterium]